MDVNSLREELATHIGDPMMNLVKPYQYLTFINSAARDLVSSGWLLPTETAENVELLSNEYEYDIPAGFAYIQDIRIGDRTQGNAATLDTGVNLGAAISDTTSTTITVGDSSIFAVNDLAQVDDEIFLITAVPSSTTLTVTRGYFSTTAATHSNAADVLRPLANVVYDEIIPRGYWRPKLQSGGANTTTAALGSRAQVVFHSGWFSFTAGTPIQFIGQKRPAAYTAGSDTIDFHMEPFIRERALAYAGRYAAGQGNQNMVVASRDAMVSSEQLLRRHPQEFRVKPRSVRVPGR